MPAIGADPTGNVGGGIVDGERIAAAVGAGIPRVAVGKVLDGAAAGGRVIIDLGDAKRRRCGDGALNDGVEGCAPDNVGAVVGGLVDFDGQNVVTLNECAQRKREGTFVDGIADSAAVVGGRGGIGGKGNLIEGDIGRHPQTEDASAIEIDDGAVVENSLKLKRDDTGQRRGGCRQGKVDAEIERGRIDGRGSCNEIKGSSLGRGKGRGFVVEETAAGPLPVRSCLNVTRGAPGGAQIDVVLAVSPVIGDGDEGNAGGGDL